jgi:hypothetical protein
MVLPRAIGNATSSLVPKYHDRCAIGGVPESQVDRQSPLMLSAPASLTFQESSRVQPHSFLLHEPAAFPGAQQLMSSVPTLSTVRAQGRSCTRSFSISRRHSRVLSNLCQVRPPHRLFKRVQGRGHTRCCSMSQRRSQALND